jgi:predicted enzyme related to lactoylglutathione lyase
MEKLIAWVEIPALDFDRAVGFYNSVLKLELQKQDFGSEKMACFPTGEGAISFAPGFKPSENGLLVSFTAPDTINETVSRIETLGGRTIIPRTKIEAEGMDYFAVCIDSEGNKIGLYGK